MYKQEYVIHIIIYYIYYYYICIPVTTDESPWDIFPAVYLSIYPAVYYLSISVLLKFYQLHVKLLTKYNLILNIILFIIKGIMLSIKLFNLALVKPIVILGLLRN